MTATSLLEDADDDRGSGEDEPLLRRLTEPSHRIRDPEDRRRARRLATVLLVLSSLTLLVSLSVPLLFAPALEIVGYRLSQVGILATLLFEAAYYVSRTRRAQLAAFATVGVALGTVWGILLTAQTAAVTTVGLALLLAPLILSALVLPLPWTMGVGALNLGGLFVLPVVRATTDALPDLPRTLVISGLTVLVVLLASLREEDLQQIHDHRSRLRATEDRIRTLYEATFEGIAVHRDGEILDANPALGPMFGLERDQVVGRSIHDLFHPDDREDVEADPPWGRGGRQEARALRADGTPFDVEFLTKPHADRDGQVWITAFRDITEQKRGRRTLLEYTARLQRTNRELEEFADVVAHDLQEPLRDIARYSQLLERDYGDRLDEDAREYIRYATEGATRLHDLLHDLVEFFRYDDRGPERELVDTEDVLDNVLETMDPELREADAEVTRDRLPQMHVDPEQLASVFEHLLENAIKFSGDDPPRVHVTASPRGNGWTFSVEDDGIGIDPMYEDRIFTLFRRLHNRSDVPGTGIGLAVCKKIVENHGGRIWVDAEDGEGARFRFRIPDRPTDPMVPGMVDDVAELGERVDLDDLRPIGDLDLDSSEA